MKTEEGVVIEVVGDVAKIRTSKHSECKDCGACPGNDSAIVTARNQVAAKPGQKVDFEVKESNELIGAFVVFALPLIFVFIGVILCGAIGGVLAFILVAVFIKLFDNHVGKNEKSMPIITRIVNG